MKQIIFPSTILEFTWLVIDGFMEENGLVPLSPQKNSVPPIQKLPKKFEILPAPSYKAWKYLWVEGSIYLENKDTNYQTTRHLLV